MNVNPQTIGLFRDIEQDGDGDPCLTTSLNHNKLRSLEACTWLPNTNKQVPSTWEDDTTLGRCILGINMNRERERERGRERVREREREQRKDINRK